MPRWAAPMSPLCHPFARPIWLSSLPPSCEGLPGVYSTIWCLCYKTNKLKKKKKQKERRWACLHRLKKRG
jgi:hypothetical protein